MIFVLWFVSMVYITLLFINLKNSLKETEE